MIKTFYLLTLAVVLPLLAPTAAQACFAADCADYALTGVVVPEYASYLPVPSPGPWLPGILPAVEAQAAGASGAPVSRFQTGVIVVGPANFGQIAVGPDACRLFPQGVNR